MNLDDLIAAPKPTKIRPWLESLRLRYMPADPNAVAFIQDAQAWTDALIQHHPNGRALASMPGVWCVNGRGSFVLLDGIDGSVRLTLQSSRMYGETPRERLVSACRHAIEPSINAFRGSQPDIIVCPIVRGIFPKDECDVDHAAPWTFARIVDRWLLDANRTAEAISGSCYQEGEKDHMIFAEEKLRGYFRDHHDRFARLRMVSRFANRMMISPDRHV